MREDGEQFGELLIVLAELDHLRDAVDCLHVPVADRNVRRIAQIVARELLDLEWPAGWGSGVWRDMDGERAERVERWGERGGTGEG